MKVIKIIRNFIKSLLYSKNPSCRVCSKVLLFEDALFCQQCRKKLKFNTGNLCARCNKPLEKGSIKNLCYYCCEKEMSFTSGFSLFVYDEYFKSVIFKLKSKDKHLLGYNLGKLLYEHMKSLTYLEKIDIIIPIPLDKVKLEKRGYNQALLIAKGVSDESGISIKENLQKIRQTKDQKILARNKRSENLIGAFGVENSNEIKDKVILLVDDVYTTGTTIDVCGKCLMESGAREVYFATLATTVTKKRR